ncbi:MAG: DUF309 domain-containing protein [Candidatus Dormibacteraceae bacterium]
MTLEAGVELFNAGRYWAAHEAWEEVWMLDRHGPDGDFWKGLIQVAAGCLHAQRQNRRGTQNKLSGGLSLLTPFRPRHLSVELEPLLAVVEANLAALLCSPAAWPALASPSVARSSPAADR